MRHSPLLISLSCIKPAAAFVAPRAFHRIPSPTGTSPALSAIIYGWDGEVEENSYSDYTAVDTIDYRIPFSHDAESSTIAEHIAQNEDRIGSLARLAVAFSPPENPLDLRTVDHVGVVSVDEHHIDIEAVVCDRSECASLLVPVSFPHDCGWDNNMEACVLDNLDELDVQARTTLQQAKTSSSSSSFANNKFNGQAAQQELELHSSVIEYPSWWISPQGNPELVVESSTVKALLNDDDLADDVRNLACLGLGFEIEQNYLISKAVVSDVGPAGFCLKALTTAADTHYVVDVSLKFDGEPRMDATSLRSAVLDAVDAAHVD